MRLGKQDWLGDEKAFKQAEEYLENWDSLRRFGLGVGFYSKTLGTGKTFLASFIARELIKRKEQVYFIRFRDVVNLLNSERYLDGDEERLRNINVLVLDEIGKAISDQQRDFFAQRLEDLIRYRTDLNKVTITTTNIDLKELDEEYPRVFSLLSAKQRHIHVKGDDARRKEIYDDLEMILLNDEIRPIR